MRYGTGVALTLSAVQVDILSHRCCVCVDTKRDHGGQENTSRLCGIWGKIWRALGTKKKYKSHTSVGRKFAPVEGLSHDLVCTGSIYHVHFAWQVWHGQLSPRFKFNKLKSFSGVEIDQNHVDKRILGGKGFAVGRLKRHNFCPASVVVDRDWLKCVERGSSIHLWNRYHFTTVLRCKIAHSVLWDL